jgi:hypothetical protein
VQSVCGAFSTSRSTVGSIIYAGLLAIRPPSEASAVSTFFFRRRQINAGDGSSDPFADPCLARPILFRPMRLSARFQHIYRRYHDCSHYAVLDHSFCTACSCALELQSPHQTLFSRSIFFLMQRPYFGNRTLSEKLTSRSMEACQERVVMEEEASLQTSLSHSVLKEPGIASTRGSISAYTAMLSINHRMARTSRYFCSSVSQARDTLEPQTGPSCSSSQASLMPHPPHPL